MRALGWRRRREARSENSPNGRGCRRVPAKQSAAASLQPAGSAATIQMKSCRRGSQTRVSVKVKNSHVEH
jgi:hypothetical protein